jgi:hypothetical protein
MGQLADTIETTATALIPPAPVASAADLMTGPQLLQIFGEIVAAVAALELITAGASFHLELSAPWNGAGNDEDSWLNGLTGDLFKKVAGVWYGRGNLKGLPGTNGNNGRNGTNGKDGTNGLSTYQLWLQDGHAGTITQFLASLRGTDGQNGTRGSLTTTSALPPFSPEYVQPTPGQLQVLPEAPEGSTLVFPALPGDVHFQQLSAERYALHRFTGSTWQLLYTTPAGATIADGSVTDAKLATDVKIGSNAAAANAFPAADRAGLTSVEKFLVYLGGKLTDIFQQLQGLTQSSTSQGQLLTTLNQTTSSNTGRIAALEARPTSGTGTGTGTGTGGHTIYVNGVSAGAQQTILDFVGEGLSSATDAAAGKTKVLFERKIFDDNLGFANYLEQTVTYFDACTITRVKKSAGVATLEYKLSTASAYTAIPFTAGVADFSAAPLAFAAGTDVSYRITLAGASVSGNIQMRGSLT